MIRERTEPQLSEEDGLVLFSKVGHWMYMYLKHKIIMPDLNNMYEAVLLQRISMCLCKAKI